LKGQCLEGVDKVFETGLNSTPCYNRCVNEMEKALRLDAQRGGEFFLIEEDRNVLLGPLAYLWAANSHFIRQADSRDGHDSAISYLLDKVSLMDYLDGSYFPLLFFELGCLYADIARESVRDEFENRDKAIMWFTRAVNEAAASEIISPFDVKRRAQEELEKLSAQS
jgi:hypothetical protein